MPKLFRGWTVVAATAFALVISGTTFAAGTFGVLTARWGKVFHWGQDEMALGLSIFLISATLAVPVVGRVVDRFGSRRVAMAGIAAMAAVMAAGVAIGGSVASLYLFYAAIGITGAFTNPVVYLRALSLWFDKRRGLALGLAVAGQGIGGAILPTLVERLMEVFDWRVCLLILAGAMVVVIGPVVALCIKDDPAEVGETADGIAPDPDAPVPAGPLPGLTLQEALGQRSFWLILLVLGLFGVASYALLGHGVYLLTEVRSLSLREAAMLQSISGMSLLLGRVAFGYLMDRVHAPLVGAAGVLMTTGAAVLLLRLDSFGPLAFAWAVMVGASTGAETDLLSLLVGRYFGKRALSQIYSWHNVAFLVGAAVGPPLFGLGLHVTGGATIPILGVGAVAFVAALLLLLLGPYPRFDDPEAEAAAAPALEPAAAPSA
ncbi:MFS transporter [Phenylobacterium sp.]|uniref:MFS transporter n=1 Tax=Phenylobacterium sp. TaxID=1871053 RepID=UPI0035B3B80D